MQDAHDNCLQNPVSKGYPFPPPFVLAVATAPEMPTGAAEWKMSLGKQQWEEENTEYPSQSEGREAGPRAEHMHQATVEREQREWSLVYMFVPQLSDSHQLTQVIFRQPTGRRENRCYPILQMKSPMKNHRTVSKSHSYLLAWDPSIVLTGQQEAQGESLSLLTQ